MEIFAVVNVTFCLYFLFVRNSQTHEERSILYENKLYYHTLQCYSNILFLTHTFVRLRSTKYTSFLSFQWHTFTKNITGKSLIGFLYKKKREMSKCNK